VNIQGAFRKVDVGGDITYMPFARARVVRDKYTSPEVDVLIDTGASCNVISISSVNALLGLSPEDARKGKAIRLSGVDRPDVFAFGWQVDLELRGTTGSSTIQLFRDVWLYVIDGSLPLAQLLLGQLDGLAGNAFIHLNRAANRKWLLRS
jgi:hypothetical protein